MDPLRDFHPIIEDWFRRRFATPTEAQSLGWPAIAQNRHTLISAPTGSGKTLAAFLLCIDRLLKSGVRGELPASTQVVYVSPLRALSNDIHRNLSIPLQEISRLASERNLNIPEIRTAVRTGDTPAHERRATARKPPHIWITTPESLYILLTSASGRRSLSLVNTLILDEIHSIAGNKRGSHLSISVERLCALSSVPITRIGLSATMHPIEDVARFLVGAAGLDSNGTPRSTIIDIGRRRNMDLQIEMPDDELGPIATLELWDETVSNIANLVREHRTTLVFVNTRRLAERVSHLLSQKIGEGSVAAHHGSLSRKTRLSVEERLKNAEIRVCVATSSLELGIDIGAVDLVCQIGSPRSIGVLLQRVGRSGHWLGGYPKGRLFPLTRDELVECAALIYGIRKGKLDRLDIPLWPLDILSQQVVAMCAAEEWSIEDLYRVLCKAYPYRMLPRDQFDRVVQMLSQGFSARLGRRSAYLHYDSMNGVLRGRRGARLAALTSGGAIPDNADYDVVADPEGTYVGSVNEEFAGESMSGDVFLLGNTSWRIRRIEKGKVRVEDAKGEAPNIPFWRGEAPARTHELSYLVSEVREGVNRRISNRAGCMKWLAEDIGISTVSAGQLLTYIIEGKRVLGSVPTSGTVMAERFFDEAGGMQLVIHALFGARINKAWGLVLRNRLCRAYGFELQASATDDGINLSLGSQHSFPLEDLCKFLRSKELDRALIEAVLESPVFTTRWRWTLTRSLALLRFSGGRRVPAPIQRMRSDDMLAAIFPARLQYLDERMPPDLSVPDHPLIFETLRDCLNDAVDLDGLKQVLQGIERGEVQFFAKDVPMPSVFAHQILNAMPYAFLDNAPLQERRARAVIMRRALPEHVDELGKLSPEAVRSASEDAWPVVRNPDEMHDALIGLILYPEEQLCRLPAEAPNWIESLVECGRAFQVYRDGRRYWAAAESRTLIKMLPNVQARFPEDIPRESKTPMHRIHENPILAIIRGWVEVSGPITVTGLAEILNLPGAEVESLLALLEKDGFVLRGFFSEKGEEEFCDRRILARIHRATIARLRREIEPVNPAAFLRFLFEWQHAAVGAQLIGDQGVLEIIDQLQGFETAAAAWEDEILKARVQDYEPSFLDKLCLTGEVIWGRWTRRSTQAEVPSRRPGLTRSAAIGLGLREDVPWLLDETPLDETSLSAACRAVLELIRNRGASFFPEIIARVRHLPSEVEEALWQLAAAGLVTADSFTPLRSLVSGQAKRAERSRHRHRRPRRTREGRWALLEGDAPPSGKRTEFWAKQYLRRYGILCRELLVRESQAPPWRNLLEILRRLEARGEIRGGRFIAGFSGEQFALPEAIDSLRRSRQKETEGYYVKVSACDPLNLVGILTPGSRVLATLGNRIVYRDGIPTATVENGQIRLLSRVEDAERPKLKRLLDERPASAFQ